MPRVSVLTAVHDPRRADLEACLASVRAQTFGDWEHVIVDDGSSEPWVGEVLAEAAAADRRVTVVRRPHSGGIVAASADALAAATGEIVALLDHDDEFASDALAAVAAAFDDPDVGVVYSDHDMIRADGRHVTPSYKPDFSPERLRSQNYVTHLLSARRTLVDEVGGFRAGFDGAQDHDLVLRLTERANRVVHVPRILYHWRQSPSSVTTSSANKPWAFEAGVRAVQDHCDRVGIVATIETTRHEGCYRVNRAVTDPRLVSVVIPTRGSSGRVWGATRAFVVDAVRSILERSTYDAIEFVVVYDTDTPASVLRALERLAGERLVLVPFDGPFNFSTKINVGVTRAQGDLLLLLNDDTELIEPRSIEVMVAHLETPGVAMVGAKLLFADGTLQHGGHVYNHDIGHACFGWGGDSAGPWPLRPLAVDRECSGVTAAAALVHRSAFEAVGGFPTELPLNYNDVDFCLKLRAAGHRIVWTPWAEWFHFESRTRTSVLLEEEYQFVNQRWHYELNNDPYYNPNLAPDRGDWLERPLRSGAPAVVTRPNAWRRLLDRRRGADRLPAGVNVVGYLDATSGLGERGRQLVRSLRAAGVDVGEWVVEQTASERAPSAARSAGSVVYDTTIAVVTARALPALVDTHRQVLTQVDRVAGYWFWELESVPDEHRYGIDLVDEIWAPTRFVADAYAAATDKPVRLVALPVPEPDVAPREPGGRPSGSPRSAFVFLSSFDHLSLMERKNPIGVVEAFVRAFTPDDDSVRLVVKSINAHLRPSDDERLRSAAAADPRITIVDEHLSAGDHAALVADADAFVSLHRSEGLGLQPAMAMWLGTPVIATRYSGTLDLMDDDSAILVDAVSVPVTGGGEAYPPSGVWADPDLDQAAAAMRTLRDDPSLRARLVEAARARMVAQADTAATSSRLLEALGSARRTRR